MNDLASDLLILAGATAYVVGVIQVPVLLQKRNSTSKRTARKIVHSLAGLSVVTIPYFRSLVFPLLLAGAATLATFFSRRDSRARPLNELYHAIGEAEEEEAGYLQGPFYYCLSITLLVALFAIFAPDRLALAITATLLMIISDPLASIVGRRWGRTEWPIPWTGSRRTLLGSAAFLISGWWVSWLYLSLSPLAGFSGQASFTDSNVLVYSTTAALTGTLVEALSPSTYDDLTVPIGSAVAMLVVSLI